MAFINISEVILNIKSGGEFSLGYVRATGSNRGSIKYIDRCTYGVKSGNHEGIKKRTTGGKDMVLRGKIPILDMITDKPYKLLISHIIQFNGQKVKH